VKKERELREEVAKRFEEVAKRLDGVVEKERELREEAVAKEKELREEAVKHERELRAEAVRVAEAQVDRRILDMLYAEEYQSLRAKLQGRKKQVRHIGEAHDSE
jgi:predicted Holliday junction resolvase-like endonuclease